MSLNVPSCNNIFKFNGDIHTTEFMYMHTFIYECISTLTEMFTYPIQKNTKPNLNTNTVSKPRNADTAA